MLWLLLVLNVFICCAQPAPPGGFFEAYSQGPIREDENQWLQSVCGQKFNKPKSKSMNSDNVEIDEAPYAVSLHIKGVENESTLCSGVLISPRHVLTAAHCITVSAVAPTSANQPRKLFVRKKDPRDITVILGDDCSRDSFPCSQNFTKTRLELQARRVYIYEEYMRKRISDIAIVELERNVKTTGSTDMYDKRVNIMQMIKTKIFDCSAAKPTILDTDKRIHDICTRTGERDRHQQPCKIVLYKIRTIPGDSGGGLVSRLYVDGRDRLIGLVSSAVPCTTRRTDIITADINLKISSFVNWICQKTGVCSDGNRQDNFSYQHWEQDKEMYEAPVFNVLQCPDHQWVFSILGTEALCIKRVEKIESGYAVVITSSLSGKRFERAEVEFTKKSGKANFTISLDARKTFQEIIGFGGAFTDAAGVNIASLSQKAQDKLLESYFSSTGLEYSTGRVPIASTDFSFREYSYDDIQGDFKLTRFKLAKEDVQFKIPYILAALNLTGQSMRLFASPWSAPGWMKTTGKMKGPGALLKGKQYHQTYADYFVRFFDEYAKNGIPFWGMTVQNEPTSGALPGYNWQTMLFTAYTQRDFIRDYLGPALKTSKNSKDLKVMLLDDARIMLPSWADVTFNDPNTTNYVAGVAVHWYGNQIYPASLLSLTHRRHPDKFILATEACTGYSIPHGPILGDWFRAEEYAYDIITDLNNFVAGWTDWNLCLNTVGGPTWVFNNVDSPILVNKTADEFYKQPMFYAMGHFSKFMRPESVRVSTKVPNELPLVQATAVVDKGRRVLVILNKSSADVQIEVEEVLNEETSLKLNLEAHSITTVLWEKQ